MVKKSENEKIAPILRLEPTAKQEAKLPDQIANIPGMNCKTTPFLHQGMPFDLGDEVFTQDSEASNCGRKYPSTNLNNSEH